MKRSDILVLGQEHLDIITALLKEGWVADPVLMPTGRPNVVEGVGAIYHLIHAELEGGADVQLYMQKSRFAEPEPVKAGEFDGVLLTLSLPHGQVPENHTPEGAKALGWEVFKVYEKVVIWLRHQKREVEKVG